MDAQKRTVLRTPMSGRMLDVDDWDDGAAPALELALDPTSLRR